MVQGRQARGQGCALVTGNAQVLNGSMSMPAYLDSDRVSEWPTTSTTTLGGTPRFNCSAIWAQRKTFVLYLGGNEMPAFSAYRCKLFAIALVLGTLVKGA